MDSLHELRVLIARHAGAGQSQPAQTRLSGLVVSAARSPTAPIHHVYEPAFALVAQGAKQIVLGDRTFRYGTGQYLVVSVDLPITGHVALASRKEPCLSVGFMLKSATIATLLLETAVGAPPGAEREISGMGVSKAPAQLIEAVVRLLRLLDHPEDIPVLGPLVEREILWRLLCGPQGTLVRQIGLADSRLSQISHAIRWIRTNFAETLRIKDLAQMAGMSISSFHRHFRAITTMSPLRYQKQIRLQEARVRLLAQTDAVAAVGFRVGYDSPSQFSREYSRVYGTPPGRDAARLRAAAARRKEQPR
jgi:AraC-like DNA-binding protein